MAAKANDTSFASCLADLSFAIKKPAADCSGLFIESFSVHYAAARLHSGGKATISIQ